MKGRNRPTQQPCICEPAFRQLFFLYQTTIADLAQADSYYEGQTVFVQGEVVGDRINDEMQPDNCWVTLQDDDPTNPSVVSVFMTMEQAKNIDTYGSYGVTGTMLQVRGTFHLDCREHQGMSDIHVEEVSALAAGSENKPGMDPKLFGLGIVSVLAGLALLALYQSKREGRCNGNSSHRNRCGGEAR